MKTKHLTFMVCLVLVLGLAMAAPSLAKVDPGTPAPAPKAITLDEITVKGQGLHRNDLPTTVNVVPAEDFEDTVGLRIEEILNEVPGVYIRSLSKAGVANSIIMRGFASGGHGGDVGIFVDGIPLNEGESHSDGYADMNVLIPLEIERLEVFKGPSSALYGNFGRGGVLAFTTKHTGEYNKIQMEYGSFNTADIQGAFGYQFNESLHNSTAIQLTRTDDYRDHSDWSRLNASTRFNYKFSDRLDMGLSFRVHQSTWNANNSIPQWMYDDDDLRKKVADYCQDDGGDKKFFSEKFDLGFNINSNMRLLYWAYGIQQDFDRFQSRTDGSQTEYFYDRRVLGTGLSLNMEYTLGGHSLTAVVGAEVYDEITDTDVYNTTDRHRDSRKQRRTFDIITYSLFAQAEYEFSRYFRPMVGLRYDLFGGTFENNDPGITPYESDINDFSKLSPKVGFRSMVLDGLDFRASYSQGFALPKSEAKFDPDIKVDPEVITQYEVGLNYQIPGLLWMDLAGYILETTDEIKENPIDSGHYENIGTTRRWGLESGIRVYPLKGLEVYGTLTIMHAEIMENPNRALVGQTLSRIPEYTATLGAKYSPETGLGASINWRKTGKYYLNDTNAQSYGGYDRVDLRLFYTIKGDAGRKYRITFSVDNLLDEVYADSVSYSGGTYMYDPAWPRTYWLGLTMDW